MAYLISEKQPVARKDYDCMACEWLNESDVCNNGFTFSEYRTIVKAKQNDYKVKKGEKYVRQCLEDGGSLYTFIAIIKIHDICLKYDLYFN